MGIAATGKGQMGQAGMTSDNWLALFMLALFAYTAYAILSNKPGNDDDST